MGHPDEGQLRAYLDGALSGEECERVRAHLAACARCAHEAAAVQARGARVQASLAALDTPAEREPVPARVAWHRLRDYRERREQTMLNNLFAPRYRRRWMAVGVVLVLAVAFSFAPVRALAGDLLALFRVRKVEFVQVDPSRFDAGTLEAAAHRFESIMQQEVDTQRDGEPQVVDRATAQSRSGIPIRLPTALGSESQIILEPGLHADLRVDLPRVRTLLGELGYGDVQLPESIHGAQVSVDFYPAVVTTYGPCGQGDTSDAPASNVDAKGCTLFVQMRSPEASIPPGLDIDRLGQAYLQLLGMSAEEATRFSQRVDWTTTLVLPIPGSNRLASEDVEVDGVKGVLVYPRQQDSEVQRCLLVWVKDGIVYALYSRSAERQNAVDIAQSLQ